MSSFSASLRGARLAIFRLLYLYLSGKEGV
jgi:hypothetical protein